METFSERLGIVPVRTALQHRSMDDHLRTALWNVFYLCTRQWEESETEEVQPLARLWAKHWKRAWDEMPRYGGELIETAKTHFMKNEWYAVYDLVEFIAGEIEEEDEEDAIYGWFDEVLAENLSPYRFVEGYLVEIDRETDVQAIEIALKVTHPYQGAHTHIEEALRLLADREHPNARLSIKESISAVESIAKLITGLPKATLSPALRKLEQAGVSLHDKQIEGWVALYGYSSDAKGIRHAAMTKPEVTVDEARYWLVSCSAFVSLLIHLWEDSIIGSRPDE